MMRRLLAPFGFVCCSRGAAMSNDEHEREFTCDQEYESNRGHGHVHDLEHDRGCEHGHDHERERAMAMALAQRAYAYSLMHVVFGSDVTAESVARVFCAQSQEVLESMRDRLARDEYGAVASRVLEADDRNFITCVTEACACIAQTRMRLAADELTAGELAETLRGDYARLFQVPGDAYVHPWESPYVGKESMLFQESTLDVRSFYHEAGFKLQSEKHFPDDHIAAMMDYLGRMRQRAYEAYADGEDEEAACVLATSRDFVEKHVLSWVDAFASKVIENDAHAYYAAFAGAMAALARFDAVWVSLTLKEWEEGM